jgi:hypothetical protein
VELADVLLGVRRRYPDLHGVDRLERAQALDDTGNAGPTVHLVLESARQRVQKVDLLVGEGELFEDCRALSVSRGQLHLRLHGSLILGR